MADQPPQRWRRQIGLLVLALVLPAVGVACYFFLTSSASLPPIVMPPEPPEATGQQVHSFCGACHAYPPPDTLPRSVWRKEIKQGYDFFFKQPGLVREFPPLESVVSYYEQRAPETLSLMIPQTSPREAPVRFEPSRFALPEQRDPPGVTHLNLVHLLGHQRPEVLVCDATHDLVLALKPYAQPPDWEVLVRGYCCARAEVVDLDSDGHKDLLLACLGSFLATDDRVGSVVWLRGGPGGKFAPVLLLEGVGRVADVRAGDFNGDGKLDLVVAVFGWRETGAILYLENRTTDWSKPAFVPHVLDQRHGTSHVPVTDLNGDGRPDFVALISQEHETIVAFLNEGNGTFRPQTLYAAPHPTFGCNGIELLDLDRDGDLDILWTNGDALDAPYLLKPYHGVHWLENRTTDWKKPVFVAHRLADLYGAGSPVAADLDGDGDLDIVAVSFLPEEYFPQRAERKLDSLVWLEQTERGQFVRHSLETAGCDHLSCAVGDTDGDGRLDLVAGSFLRRKRRADESVRPAVMIWKNLGGKQE